MKKLTFLFLFYSIVLINTAWSQGFKATQQKNSRVHAAYAEKWADLQKELVKKAINKDNFELFIRVFKSEHVLEVWLRSRNDKEFKLFKKYDICAPSGVLGPKRKQGDGQVPEGFYSISVFNPYSNYYLSLGLNYPNASDRIIGKNNLGGDIMIHGNCVTIGCIPLTDTYIKEVYIMAVEARNSGQQTIPVHIFPTRLDDAAVKSLALKYDQKPQLLDFWKNLKTGYDYFESYRKLPKVAVDKAGKYTFN